MTDTRVWEVTTTDGTIVATTVKATLPDYRADWVARSAVPHAFASRPAGCTGFAFNVHFGCEEACPIHRSGVSS